VKQTTREWAKSKAKSIKIMTVEESKELPGFLGKIVPVQLSMHGWYAHETGHGVSYYELPEQGE
jgi:hypothetical protein